MNAVNQTGQKVAIVTGGSQGIGAALVAGYRRQGWSVVATARTMKPTEDPDVLTVDGDIAQPGTADRIIGGALERFGRIDTLVNNAGVFVSKPFTDYTAEDYALVVGVNLTGFFRLTQQVIAEMLKRRSGHVVNITTTLADYANSAVPAVLTALTKGGLASATKSLAVEYASRDIRVNAVSLGIIQTPAHPAASYDGLGDQLPLLGVGQVSDVVDGILFLEASPYVTGEILHIDGGQSAVPLTRCRRTGRQVRARDHDRLTAPALPAARDKVNGMRVHAPLWCWHGLLSCPERAQCHQFPALADLLRP